MTGEDDEQTTMRYRSLRQRAEAALRDEDELPPEDLAQWSQEQLVQELQAHRIERQMHDEELRRAQFESAQSRDRYHELYDLAPVGYLTLDRRGTIEEANVAAAELMGQPATKLLGRPLASLLSTDDADALHRHLHQAFASGTRQGCEVVLPRGEGPSLTVRIESIAPVDATGQRSVCRSALVDLTALRSAQEELRDSETRFRQIAEHLKDGLVIVPRGRRTVSYANPACEQIFGRPLDELYAGQTWLEWIHRDDLGRIRRAYARYLAGEPFDDIYRIERPDGEIRWLRARAFPIEEGDGPVGHDIGLLQDITAERELEEELRQAQKMEAVGALASGVAHDFNNVLQAILGCINVARREGTDPARVREFLDRAATAARGGGELAAQLMAFARKQDAEPRPIEIDAVVGTTVGLIQRLVTERIRVEFEPGAAGLAIVADAVQIEQILMNLASNARDAMPEGGTLSIRTVTASRPTGPSGTTQPPRPARWIRLVVEDTGAGMDDQTRARIFEPFFTTKEPGKGTGLGLAMVFAMIKRLGGRIEVDSRPGQGTRFTLAFPCSALAPLIREPSGPHGIARFRGTALLVEDQPIVRMTVRHYLEELGLRVLEASGADEVQHLCDAHRGTIDLLVSDVVLPFVRGPALATLVQARYPDVRVLFMSASHELAGVRPDHAMVLRKPFGLGDLTRALEKVMGPEHKRDSAAGPQVRRHETSSVRLGAQVQASGECILLVEDELASRLALGEVLREQGYRVLMAANATEALSAVAGGREKVDLLLTDIRLPEVGGVELAERLRDEQPDLKVVFMSGLLDPPIGSEAFVRKPIDLDLLLGVLEQTIG